MGDEVRVEWVAAPVSGGFVPAVSFYGLLVPYLYLPGTSMTWSGSQSNSKMTLFLEALVREERPDRISTAELQSATGIPARFWALTLLDLEQRGLVKEGQTSADGNDLVFATAHIGEELTQATISKRKTRAVRDILVFVESEEILIASDDPGALLNTFIRMFTQGDKDWFRTGLRPDPLRRNFRAYLAAIAASARSIGPDADTSDIVFGVTGSRPVFAPVRAIAGVVDINNGTPVPWFTHMHVPGENGLRTFHTRHQLFQKPHMPMTRLGSMARRIEERLRFCISEDVMQLARRAAPRDDPVCQTLKAGGDFQWVMEDPEPSRYALDIKFSDMRFRIMVGTTSPSVHGDAANRSLT